IYSDGESFGRAMLTITSSTLSSNSAVSGGGGIYNNGESVGSATLTITNSTLSGNSAEAGGGMYNDGALAGYVTVQLANSTLSGNSADGGGGIYNDATVGGYVPVGIGNTILDAGASGDNIENDEGTVTSDGYNLSSDDGGGFLGASGDLINTNALLGPLADNGGPTFTHALLTNSPAINAGNPGFTPPPDYDQRGPGFARVVGFHIDIGAFELDLPPVAQCQDVTVFAGAFCTANASIDDGSYDPLGDPITLSQSPAGPYGLGTNSVTLTVTDAQGATNSCTANVVVVDTTPPSIVCPSDIVTDGTSPAGADVSFAPTASDNCTLASVSCSPASGSTFPIGTTTVTCQAVDGAGHTNSCTFTVHVAGADEQSEAALEDLGTDPNVTKNLIHRMESINRRIAKGKTKQACKQLEKYIKYVAKQQSKGKLSASDADTLTSQAEGISAVLGC
ncbi:MAG TPA: choice-of-anchor Q domain-containing protein, partial [Verrucomicrobiae bacterium]|nr:choice-of-anchor Q domain-containing protein [Verrucomicrobiae bacterium]